MMLAILASLLQEICANFKDSIFKCNCQSIFKERGPKKKEVIDAQNK